MQEYIVYYEVVGGIGRGKTKVFAKDTENVESILAQRPIFSTTCRILSVMKETQNSVPISIRYKNV